MREVDIPVTDTQSDSQQFYYSICAYLQLAVLYSFAVCPNDDDMQILVPSDGHKLGLYCGCIDRLVPFAQLYVGFCK